ncbi:hypothetical protein BGX21_002156 [Mortierella sp. AD011]|nr:hypothetical protein BGX20_001817 [Mortierella sp. AD010]KAF9381249.1 hypothetical protein BGX21_002156 [Mortierella sp. AD011]
MGIKGDLQIMVYDVKTQRITQEDVGKAYGIQDMYRDLKLDDCMQFEKLLANLESAAATFVHTIRSGSKDVSITRAKLLDFKKFLVIMMYRHEGRRRQYYEELFDFETRRSIQRHMGFNSINDIRDVWFENLKWIIKTPVHEINKELGKVNRLVLGEITEYEGPIHSAELMDFGHITWSYVCIWEAQEGSEFILTDNCFGCYEGHGSIIIFHNFFVISPEYVVVLVNRLYMDGIVKSMPCRKSWFEGFHSIPDCVYINKNAGGAKDFTPDDLFKYRRIVIPKQKVWLVNGIFLDEGHKYISHRSNAAMYRSLMFYDKVKDKMFTNKHDYSVLRRRLFFEMNRTHR